MEKENVAFIKTTPFNSVNKSSKNKNMERKIKLNGKKIKPEVLNWILNNKSTILKYRALKEEWYKHVNN